MVLHETKQYFAFFVEVIVDKKKHHPLGSPQKKNTFKDCDLRFFNVMNPTTIHHAPEVQPTMKIIAIPNFGMIKIPKPKNIVDLVKSYPLNGLSLDF